VSKAGLFHHFLIPLAYLNRPPPREGIKDFIYSVYDDIRRWRITFYMKARLTKKPMTKVVIFNTTDNDFELLTLAAQQKEVSRSDFLRMALREKASRVLAGLEDHLSSEVGSVLGLRGTSKKDSK